jgi:hypothetical protein
MSLVLVVVWVVVAKVVYAVQVVSAETASSL